MKKPTKLRRGRQSMTVKEWADKLGLAESTIRARLARGEDPTRARQMVRTEITPKLRSQIARAKGTLREVAAKYGVSRTTVMNIRNQG